MKCKPHLSPIVRFDSAHPSRMGSLRLDRNERVAAWPDSVHREIQALLTPEVIMAYPEIAPVYEKLSSHLGLKREMLLLSHASDAALKSIFEVYVGSGDNAVMINPSYAMYPVYAQMVGANAVEVDVRPDLTLPLEDILNAIDSNTRLVCLPNPNQPIERLFSRGELETVAALARKNDFILVIDEAYHYFTKETALDFVSSNENVIITRSFSKAFGLAGLRAGLTIAHERRITELKKIKPISEINSIAATLIPYFLDHMELVEAHVAEVAKGRELVAARAHRMGLEPHGTTGNSILIEFADGETVSRIVQNGLKQKILLKGPFEPHAPRHMRISLGPQEDMERAMNFIEGELR